MRKRTLNPKTVSSANSLCAIVPGTFRHAAADRLTGLLQHIKRLGRHTCVLIAAASLWQLAAGGAYAVTATTVPISAELGTSIARDLFPLTISLNQGKLFLTEPALLFLDQQRVGMQVRFQAYDHRPQQSIAVSELGRAQLSGTLDYDPVSRQVLLVDPRIDKIQFDSDNAATRRFLADIQAAWSAQITNPVRSALPQHPYLIPIRNNIQDLAYDGKSITLTLSYQ